MTNHEVLKSTSKLLPKLTIGSVPIGIAMVLIKRTERAF